MNFAKFLRTPTLHNIYGRLQWNARIYFQNFPVFLKPSTDLNLMISKLGLLTSAVFTEKHHFDISCNSKMTVLFMIIFVYVSFCKTVKTRNLLICKGIIQLLRIQLLRNAKLFNINILYTPDTHT